MTKYRNYVLGDLCHVEGQNCEWIGFTHNLYKLGTSKKSADEYAAAWKKMVSNVSKAFRTTATPSLNDMEPKIAKLVGLLEDDDFQLDLTDDTISPGVRSPLKNISNTKFSTGGLQNSALKRSSDDFENIVDSPSKKGNIISKLNCDPIISLLNEDDDDDFSGDDGIEILLHLLHTYIHTYTRSYT